MVKGIPKLSMKVIVVIVAVIVAISIGSVAAGVFKKSDNGSDSEPMEMEMTTATFSVSGTAQEGTETTEPLDFGGAMVHKIKVTFTWEDDNPDSNPDQFSIRLMGQNWEETASGAASPLEIMIDLDSGESMGTDGEDDCCGMENLGTSDTLQEEEEGSSEWTLHITLTDGGDQEFGPLGLITIEDNSNPYDVEVEFTHCICCPPEVV